MPVVLKFVCDGDIRRTRVETLSFDEVRRGALQAFPELAQRGFHIKYRDDEDDLCLLTPASCDDFAQLKQYDSSVRLEVEKMAEGSSAKLVGDDADMEHNESMPPPFAEVPAGSGSAMPSSHAPPHIPHFLHHILNSLRNASENQNNDALAALFIHFIPMILQHISGHHKDLERLAAQAPEMTRAILQALRDSLEPFPQMQEAQQGIEQMLQTGCFQVLGTVAEGFFRTLGLLPFEQQRDIASIVIGGVTESFLQAMPAEMPSANTQCHYGVICDGCGQRHIAGARFKCRECPDYDLCGECYSRKDEIHAAHSFECMMQPAQCSKGKGLGKHLLKGLLKGCGKGLHKGWKGWGKHGQHWPHAPGAWWGKGMGKGHGGWTSSSSDSDSTSSSESTDKEFTGHASKKERRASMKESRRQMREARRAHRTAMKEAKKRFKEEKKAAKKTFKAVKKAMKEQAKSAKKAHNQGMPATADEAMPAGDSSKLENAPESKEFTFPVEVGDGRKLTISWKKTDDPEQVARQFAAIHHIGEDEHNSIVAFIYHAMSLTGSEEAASTQTPGTSEAMDVSDTHASAPPYCNEEQLQSLENMGFPNRELNAELLAANDGDMQRAIDQLLKHQQF